MLMIFMFICSILLILLERISPKSTLQTVLRRSFLPRSLCSTSVAPRHFSQTLSATSRVLESGKTGSTWSSLDLQFNRQWLTSRSWERSCRATLYTLVSMYVCLSVCLSVCPTHLAPQPKLDFSCLIYYLNLSVICF
jgi:hypothetical protein